MRKLLPLVLLSLLLMQCESREAKIITFYEVDTTAALPANHATLKPVLGKELRQIIREAEQPIIVSLWASWCQPCMYELPALARLQEEHPNVRILLVNSDPNTDFYQTKIRHYLTRIGFTGETYQIESHISSGQVHPKQVEDFMSIISEGYLDQPVVPYSIYYRPGGEIFREVAGYGADSIEEGVEEMTAVLEEMAQQL